MTRRDAVLGITCVAFLLANIQALTAGGRGRAKQAVCQMNLMQLTTAWTMYADDNGDMIVNGSHGFAKNSLTGDGGPPNDGKIKPWVGRAFEMIPPTNTPIADQMQEKWRAMLRSPQDKTEVPGIGSVAGTNLLYKYCQNLEVYRCPTGQPKEVLTYSIVDAMFGAASWGGQSSGFKTLGPVLRRRAEIAELAQRFVFIDEGRISPDSWSLPYNQPAWHDLPPIRHNLGATFSLADGHSEYRKWVDERTIALGQRGVMDPNMPTQACNPDLEWVQMHAWGELGYDRSDYGCTDE